MNTIISDGGRSTSSHPGEKLDCVVRALAIAGSMPYDDAHAIVKKHGRKDRHKFYGTGEYAKFIGSPACKRSGSVGKFAHSNPVGSFLVRVRGHAFALINGEAHDMFPVSEKLHIRQSWRMQ